MRYAVAFFAGAIVGAFSLFLYLQESGRMAAPPVPRTPVDSTAAGSRAEAPMDSAAPSVESLDPSPGGDRVVALPSPAVITTQTSGSVPPRDPETVPKPTLPITAAPAAERLVIPVAGIQRSSLRDTFDEARGGRKHNAIDILAPRGTAVVSSIDGVIRKIFTSKAGGLTLYVADPANEWIYYYAHLDSYATGLREGMNVRQGQLLGTVGTTGNAPVNTPHLHFSIEKLPPTKEWWKGSAVNPYPLLASRGVTFDAPAR